MPTRNVNLSEHHDGFVQSLVDNGLFTSASEVFRAGLRLLELQEQEDEIRLVRLRAEVQKGIDDFNAGRYIEFKDEADMRAYFEKTRNSFDEELSKSDDHI